MRPDRERILCRTPTPGKQGTRIPRWKYDILRSALRSIIPKTREGVPFKDVPDLVATSLDPAVRIRIGSIAWHVVTVKLHLEVLGEVERIPNITPQRVRLRR